MQDRPITTTVEELLRLEKAHPPLDHSTQQALATVAKTGTPEEREAAIEALFKHNASRFLFFVRMYARDVEQKRTRRVSPKFRYMLRWKDYAPWSVTSDTILDAVLEGFWVALKTFDPTRGNFNNHVNVLIWQRIMKVRKDAERQERLIAWSADSQEYDGDDASTTDERKIARAVFEIHLDRLCPQDAGRVKAMLEGTEEPDPKVLRTVRERFRSSLPETELLWLGEVLGWRS